MMKFSPPRSFRHGLRSHGFLDQQIRFWNRHTGLPSRRRCAGLPGHATCRHADGRTLIRANSLSDHVRIYRVADLFPPATLPPEDALLLAEIDAAAEVHQAARTVGRVAWFAKWKQFRAKHPEWHRW